MTDASYTVRFGADTAALKQGTGEASSSIRGVEGTLESLDATLKKLEQSIARAFKAPAAADGVKRQTDENKGSVDRLIKSIEAETRAWGLNKQERLATIRTMQQVQQLERSGTVVTKAQTAAIMEQNRALAMASMSKSTKGSLGFLGLEPYQLQNLSYQVNDFFTQLASGSGVLQATAQQGGQVFQIFQDRVGALLRFLPMIGTVAVGVGLALAALSTLQTNTVMLREFNAQLLASADGGMYSAEVLLANARILDQYGGSLDEARSNLSMFLREGVRTDEMVEFGEAAQDLADVYELELTDAAKQVTEAFTGNYDSVADLDDAINFLTDTEREHIRVLFESGDAQGARTEAFNIFRAVIGESAEYQRGPASEAARALEQAWDNLMGSIANSTIITSTMNELRELIGLVERALELTGATPTASGGRRGAFGATFRSPETTIDMPDWIGDLTVRRPEWTYPEFWTGGTPDFGQPEPPPPAPAQISRPGQDRSVADPLRRTIQPPDAQISRAPAPETQAQAKAEQELTLAYERQAEAAGGLSTEQRLLRAEREGLARAAAAGLNNEASLRVAAAARAAEQEKIDQEAARAGEARSRSATATREREAREAYRLAQESLRDHLEALDTEQAALEDNYARSLEIQEQKLVAIGEFYGEDSRQYQSALQQKLRIERQYQNQQEQIARIRAGAMANIAQIEADEAAAIRSAGLDEERANIQQQLDMRLISEEDALAALADVRQREIDLEMETAQRIHDIRMAQLRMRLQSENLSVIEREQINAQLVQQEREFQATMAALRRQSDANTAETSRETARVVHDAWRDRVEPIGQAFSGMFTGLATQTQTFGDAWNNLGRSLLSSVDQWVGEQITKWLTAEALKLQATVAGEGARTAATTAGVAARTGAEAAGAATTVSLSASTTLADVANQAVRAAAGAYAAIAGIPIIGPILAPLTAAAALAGVLALGSKIFSAEGGWGEVPHDGAQTVLHKKEMVLPAQYATPLRAMLTSSRPTGALGLAGGLPAEPAGGVNGQGAMMEMLSRIASREPMSVSISALDRRSLRRFIDENSGDLQDAIQNRVRDLKINDGP